MNVLLIYPKFPPTFFGFNHALHFLSKKAVEPPLGLITASALIPDTWQKKLVDLNVSKIVTPDLIWADYIFISAMIIQKESVYEIIKMCQRYNLKIIAGGPLFTNEVENFPGVDHFILNEAELTLPLFLNDLEKGCTPIKIYQTNKYADIINSPTPDFHLLSLKAYASINLQISRGCPYICDFCEIPGLHGNKVRIKNKEQVIKELETIYRLGWRGLISIVDDNFTGNKKTVKNELLPAIINWMKEHNYPFIFNVQTSVNIADDDELLGLMALAGIQSTFIGFETVSEETLQSSNKLQNCNRDMSMSVQKIQKAGLQVSGGFIVGFDTDTARDFVKITDFIQKNGIVWAMVGLLNAPKNTKLYQRLKKENRIIREMNGNNTDYSINFIPRTDISELIKNYRDILLNIYSIKSYYKRIRQLFKIFNPSRFNKFKIEKYYFLAFLKSIIILGVLKKGQTEFWKFILWMIIHKPRLFYNGILFAICGYHFRKEYNIT